MIDARVGKRGRARARARERGKWSISYTLIQTLNV